jgi:hypothetical protein
LVSDKTVSISSRREIKAEQAQMIRMEQSPLWFDIRQKRSGSDIPRIDKHIQTDIVVGSNEIKQEMFELLSKRNYSKSDISKNHEKL